MENNFSKIKAGETHAHYLEKRTESEPIQIVSDKILEAIVTQVRDSMYFIILDCTPDIRHQEQMSIILALKWKPEIKEHFLGFVNIEVTKWLNLSTVILSWMSRRLHLKISGGKWMIMGPPWRPSTKTQLSQSHAHPMWTPNLVIVDAAKSSFGHVQKLFWPFSWHKHEEACAHNCEVMEWHEMGERPCNLVSGFWGSGEPDEPVTDALKNLEDNYFNIVVDSAVDVKHWTRWKPNVECCWTSALPLRCPVNL